MDAFAARSRIPQILEKFQALLATIQGEFVQVLQKEVDRIVCEQIDGLVFLETALPRLAKRFEQVAQEIREQMLTMVGDLSAYRDRLEKAITNAPLRSALYLHLALPTGLASYLLAAQFQTLSMQLGGTVAPCVAWVAASELVNGYHETKVNRLREEYWQAVKQKWRTSFEIACQRLTMDFYETQRTIIGEEQKRVHSLFSYLTDLEALFRRLAESTLEEGLVSRQNILTADEADALYREQNFQPAEEARVFLQERLSEGGWRAADLQALEKAVFETAFNRCEKVCDFTLEEYVMRTDKLSSAQEQLEGLRLALSPLLRCSLLSSSRVVLAMDDPAGILFADDLNRRPERPTRLQTGDALRLTWLELVTGFGLQELSFVRSWQQAYRQLTDEGRASAHGVEGFSEAPDIFPLPPDDPATGGSVCHRMRCD